MEGIEFEPSESVAQITINRPARRNALGVRDWMALRDAAHAASEGGARAVMLRGAGGVFSAGFDLSELDRENVAAAELISEHVNPALKAIRDIPVPTIAAVEGACVGGGFGIAASCDIILASETASFGAPYVKIGIVADTGLHSFLRNAIGYQRAAELIFTGRTLSAQAAFAYGLCAELIAQEQFESRCTQFCKLIANGPTQALIRSKTILQATVDIDESMAMEARMQGEIFMTEDAAEGITAFLEGRRPRFRGK